MGVIDKARGLFSSGEKRTLYQCNACMETFVPQEEKPMSELRCPICNDPNVRER
ncbi:hypothetical protein SAMN04487950_3241 [Halogranum rubrum]|uniref:Uncharacterized protein n=1 Tax=Halogranum rubrum TaxID=553466 RepID=A0A1I4GFU4_9EURY|nr:hypothetical protein [Halogranum rubrum]SFL28413.1 hypothetical protein SAMN04487950_3241 [Halogranum rubrum]